MAQIHGHFKALHPSKRRRAGPVAKKASLLKNGTSFPT
jgi:hypothetical protein